MQYIECTIFNKEAELEFPVDLRADTNATLFLSEKELKDSDQFIDIDPDYTKWILSKDEYKIIFEKVADFVGTDTENFVKIFLSLIAREDRDGYKFLCNSKFSKKECFLKTFEDFMKDFIVEGTKNIIAPDILLCVICHYIFNTTHKQDIEIPIEIIPYVFNVEEEKPEDYPENFDPNIQYEKNTNF